MIDRAIIGRWLRDNAGLLLVVAALAAHAPFVTMVLCGEEGNFGRATVKILERQRPVLVIARDLHGREYTTVPGHNLGGYVLPGLTVAPALRMTGFSTDAQRAGAAVALRGAFLALYAGALFLALAAIPRERRLVGGLLLALFSLFPLPLLASAQVQYDGAVSTLLLVAAVTAMVRAMTHADDADRRPLLLLAAGGFAVSLGKLEFVAVASATMLVVAAWQRRPLALVGFIGGLLAGTTLCYAVDRANLVGGYDVIRRFSGIQEHIPLSTRVAAYVPANANYLWPLYMALPLAWIAFAIDRARRRWAAPLVAATLVFVGYVAIAWRGDGFPRYFAPAFVLLPVALAQVRLSTRIVLAIALVVVAPFAVRSWLAERDAGRFALCDRLSPRFDARQWIREHQTAQPCVPALGMESAPGWYSRRVPFACCGAQWTTEFPDLAVQLCR
jgi:hypothetical protein